MRISKTQTGCGNKKTVLQALLINACNTRTNSRSRERTYRIEYIITRKYRLQLANWKSKHTLFKSFQSHLHVFEKQASVPSQQAPCSMSDSSKSLQLLAPTTIKVVLRRNPASRPRMLTSSLKEDNHWEEEQNMEDKDWVRWKSGL